MNILHDTCRLVFVYLGRLPEYVIYSLKINSKYNRITLLHDCEIQNHVANVEYINIDDFYDRRQFVNLIAESPLKNFRDGFWYKTTERFYVLRAYMDHYNVHAIFHAELDNIVYNLEGVSISLDKIGNGLFYPILNNKKAAASFMYINSFSELDALIGYFNEQKTFKDDMQLLAEYASASVNVFPLPSENSLCKMPVSNEVQCIYDAASIGQYLLGIDFRNASRPIFNGFQNENCIIDLSQLKFIQDGDKGILMFYDQAIYLLKNIHVHSKVFKRMYLSESYVPRIMKKINGGKKSLMSLNFKNMIKLFLDKSKLL